MSILILLLLFTIVSITLIYRYGALRGLIAIIAIVSISTFFIIKKSKIDIWATLNEPMYSAHKIGEKALSLKIAKGLFKISDLIFTETDIRRVEAIHHIAWLNWDIKNYKEAEKYLNTSLRLYNKILDENKKRENKIIPPGVHGAGNEYYLLAAIYKSRGDLEQAIELAKKAKEYFKKEEPQYIWYRKDITLYLADLYKEKGRTREAKSLYLEANRL